MYMYMYVRGLTWPGWAGRGDLVVAQTQTHSVTESECEYSNENITYTACLLGV